MSELPDWMFWPFGGNPMKQKDQSLLIPPAAPAAPAAPSEADAAAAAQKIQDDKRRAAMASGGQTQQTPAGGAPVQQGQTATKTLLGG